MNIYFTRIFTSIISTEIGTRQDRVSIEKSEEKYLNNGYSIAEKYIFMMLVLPILRQLSIVYR